MHFSVESGAFQFMEQQHSILVDSENLYRKVGTRLLRAFIVLFVMGVLIGVFRQYDLMVAVVLGLVAVFVFWNQVKDKNEPYLKAIILIGMLLTGTLGVIGEKWGIGNGYWYYHDLPDQRDFAYWLFFAYALAFLFLYRVEASFIQLFRLESFKAKFTLAVISSIVFPTLGEIVAINSGVWTYNWGYQFFGVPALAIFCLMALHTTIYCLFTYVCRSKGIVNPVFGIRKSSSDSSKDSVLDTFGEPVTVNETR